MKILLKDPAKVDAVIKKITDKCPCHDEMFLKWGVESLKKKASENDPMILEVDWGWSLDYQGVESTMRYWQYSEIPTDAEFINDKEW